MVSIIMPAYNAEKTISESIDSVLKQTFKKWELIIVNDCSNDRTKEIISEYLKDSRIRYFENEKNLKVAETRNKGISESLYKYIAFLDSDDLWDPKKLEVQVDFMEKHNIAFSSTDYELISEDSDKLNKIVKAKNKNYKQLLRGNSIGCLTVVINKDKIKNLEMSKIGHEDYALWLKILRVNNLEVAALNQNLAMHRVGHVSLSSNKFKKMRLTWNIFRREEKIRFTLSIYLMFCYAINSLFKVKKIKENV